MARIDDLVKDVPSKELQDALRDEVAELRRHVPFGLVFERHLPEFAVVPSEAITLGSCATPRDDHGRRLRVVDLDETEAKVTENGSAEPQSVPLEQLVAVRGLSEKIFPGLTSVERIERAPDKPWHAVINSENYHAIQLLEHVHSGQVDCIYIDPPYNTGARDWTYNNHYVDDNDSFRHSKWLSFMEKRLTIAKRLLKADGVLIVTIDEHEVHHLGLLLEQLFPDAVRQMVMIVNNPKGVTETRFSRVEEYACFCFLGDAGVAGIGDDLLTPLVEEPSDDGRLRWKGLLRSGAEARREDRRDMFYPVLIDPDRGAVVGTGDPLPLAQEPDFDKRISGHVPVWPVRRDRSLGRWAVGRQTLSALIEKGYVALGSYDEPRRTWGLSYLSQRHRDQIDAGLLELVDIDEARNVVDVRYVDPQVRRIKRVWHRTSHDAGAYGSDLVRTFLGGQRLFAFPKSVYATRDCLAAVTAHKPDALIVDFFAGSGTTLHATSLLNAEDGGRRRCILVTNNEVDGETASKLAKDGHYAGDAEYDSRGVFEAVTRPRCTAALTGERPDGKPVEGKYLDGRRYGDGFEENCEFFKLDYLDPDRTEMGFEFDRLLPALWLTAGAVGPVHGSADAPYSIADGSPYAIFSRHGYLREFREKLEAHGGIRHLFFLTNSEDAYAELRGMLATPDRQTHMLWNDYMNFFRRYRGGG